MCFCISPSLPLRISCQNHAARRLQLGMQPETSLILCKIPSCKHAPPCWSTINSLTAAELTRAFLDACLKLLGVRWDLHQLTCQLDIHVLLSQCHPFPFPSSQGPLALLPAESSSSQQISVAALHSTRRHPGLPVRGYPKQAVLYPGDADTQSAKAF